MSNGDHGTNYTDQWERELARRIEKVYKEAQRDIEQKIGDFNKRYKVKEAIHLKELADGKITQEDFDAWKSGQIFQSKRWIAKRAQVTNAVINANKTAVRIINKSTSNIFEMNGNFMAYSLEHGAGVNFGFDLYDADTVIRLIKDNPQILPEWKIDEKKDYVWNEKKVNNSVLQGIIQGERLDQISKRIAESLSAQNKNLMKTFARTAMTGAQNAGREVRLKEATLKGIKVQKEWMATFDARTRDSHASLDGEKVDVNAKFSNGLRFPGDPAGPAREVYNCRCTMVGDLVDFPSEYNRYDNIDGKPIKSMTYREWEKAKKSGVTLEPWISSQVMATVDSFQSKLGMAKTVTEINNLMNNQGWFRKTQDGTYSQVNLTGCDVESAKSIAAAYEQVFERYPQLKGKLDAPNAQPVGMKNSTYAWCYIKQNGKVQVNPSVYNNWQALVKQYEDDVISGWHPRGTTAESIVIHEIGHAIDGLLAREGILGGITASGEYRYASSTLKNTIMNRVAKLDTNFAKYWNAKDWDGKADKFWQSYATEHYVSQYATKNNQEWFAECFAEYITSANPRAVASEFGKELEKLIAKIGG